ncbi:MAG: hypothetical protein JXB45_05880 [Candidatus Krumholzibacteriota bacterium]|nr:hypothetical protein [Candidatus Krumholzibacteriota bacterium]
MSCKEIRDRLLEIPGFSTGLPEEICRHLSGCPECARFRDDLVFLRGAIADSPAASPPPLLLQETRRLCLQRIAAARSGRERLQNEFRFLSLPFCAGGALLSLLALTIFLILSVAGEYRTDQVISSPALFLFCLLLQNLVMLFFAPLLIYRYRIRRGNHQRIYHDRN